MTDGDPDLSANRRSRRPAEPPVGGRGDLVRQALPIYYALLLAILTVCGIILLWRLRDVLLLLFISVLFASTVSGPSAFLERVGLPRLISALLVYALAFAILLAVGWFVVPPTFTQVAELVQNAPEYADRYEDLRAAYEELREEYPQQLQSFDQQIAGFQNRILSAIGNWLIDLPARTFAVILDLVAVFVVSMLIVASRDRILAFILSMVHPSHRDEVQNVLVKMWKRIGHYLRAKLIVMAIVGVLMYGALLLIGVRFAVMLAIIVALGQLIPRVGPWLGRIPLLSIALLDGWTTLVLTAAASVVIENFKGFIISPFVEGDQLNIPPLLVFVAVLSGAALFGPLGAFVAVPFAAMVQVLFEEVIIPWRKRQFGEEPAPALDERSADVERVEVPVAD